MLKLMEKNIVGAEFARQSFRATPAAGTEIEDMLKPEYWTHVARNFNPHDIIEVVPEDGAFYARLIVLNSAKLWAKMYKLEYVELSAAAAKANPPVSNNLEAKFAGPVAKWRAVNKETGAAVATDSFQTRDEAEAWIEKHSKEMAA